MVVVVARDKSFVSDGRYHHELVVNGCKAVYFGQLRGVRNMIGTLVSSKTLALLCKF